MNFISALLLLFMEESDAFWALASIVEDLLPADYYTHSMEGATTDLRVLATLLQRECPKIAEYFETQGVLLHAFAAQWILCLFINVLPVEVI